MNKHFINQDIASTNDILTSLRIPFQISLKSVKGKHPALILNNTTGSEQLRQGNYRQLANKLHREYAQLVKSFSGTTQVCISSGDEVYTTMHNHEISVNYVAQSVANLLRKKVLVVVDNRYSFYCYPL